MWLSIFLTLLGIVGPYILQAILDWIKTMNASRTLAFDAVPVEAPEMVRVHRKSHRILASLLSDPKTRGARMAVMQDRIERCKRERLA